MKDAIQIAKEINTIKDGVDKSFVGPIFTFIPDDVTKKTVDQMAWATFTILLQSYFKQEGSFKEG